MTRQEHAVNSIEVVFKNCAPCIDYISGINNTQIDNAKDIDVVMTRHNLIDYSDNHSKTPGILWQYFRDEPSFNDNNVINSFPDNSTSFKFNQKTLR